MDLLIELWEAGWEGLGLGSVLQTAARRPAPKALLRPW